MANAIKENRLQNLLFWRDVLHYHLYRVFARFSLFEYSKISHLCISSDKTLSSEKNDTKIIEIGWVALIHGHFWNHSHFQVSLHSCDISVRGYGFSDFHTLLPGSPLIVQTKPRENSWTAIPAVNSSHRFNTICKWLCFKKWL